MEKSKSNKKQDKKGKNNVNSIKKVFVKTYYHLTHCLTNKIPFAFDPNLTTAEIPYSPWYPFEPLIEVLNNTDTITGLIIRSEEKVKSKDRNAFVTCLSEHKTIVQISFIFIFDPSLMEAMTSILVANPRIKKIEIHQYGLLADGFKTFYENMEHYKLEELEIEPPFGEKLAQSLMSNQSIKKIKIGFLEGDGFTLLCQVLVSKEIEEFWYSGAITDYESLKEVLKANHLKKLTLERRDHPMNFNLIAEELKTNTSIVELSLLDIQFDWKILGPSLAANKTIKRLILSVELTDEQISLLDLDSTKEEKIHPTNIISDTTMTKLDTADEEDKIHPASLSRPEVLMTNSSITDLVVIGSNTIEWKALGEIISKSKTIKRLELKDLRPDISSLNLGSNTTLTELNLIRSGADRSILFNDLCTNQALLKLFVHEPVDLAGIEALRKFLTTNRSLKELQLIGLSPFNSGINGDTVASISEALRVNRTLRKIIFNIPRIKYQTFSEFIEALKINTTLTELNIGRFRDIKMDYSPLNGKEADDFILELLKTNKTLRLIEGASEYPYLEDRLKENRKTQDRAIRNTCMTIKMIIARPNSFFLPIEIWLQIFAQISDWCFDFMNFFNRELNKGDM